MAASLRGKGEPDAAIRAFLRGRGEQPRRSVLFIRVAQDWDAFIQSIPRHRFVELAERTGVSQHEVPHPGATSETVEAFLERTVALDLGPARDWYRRLGGDVGAAAANGVATSFTGLGAHDINRLEAHAAWQIHATHAVYGL